MNALSSLWGKLSGSKRYRDSFAASVVKRMIPLQVRVLRKQREWSQERLAKESQLTQGVISRAEDPDYGNLTINTLVRVAAGFDCAFVGRFAPFSELGKWYAALDSEHELEVPSFAEDAGFIERKPAEAELGYRTTEARQPWWHAVSENWESGGIGSQSAVNCTALGGLPPVAETRLKVVSTDRLQHLAQFRNNTYKMHQTPPADTRPSAG